MKIYLLKPLLFLMAIGLFFTACEDDGTGGLADAPSTTLIGADVTAAPGDTVSVTLEATEGNSPLRTLTVLEDGVNVSFDRLIINDSPASSNPILLISDADKINFTRSIGVIVPAGAASSYLYEYVVADEDNRTTTKSIVVSIAATPPTFAIQGSGATSGVPGSLKEITIAGTAGSVDMESIAVSFDGVLADVADLEFGGVDFITNPNPLVGADRQAFEKKLLFRLPATGGDYVMTVSILDVAGNVTTDELMVLAGSTPLSYIGSVFFNAIGSMNGGLDLDTGNDVPSSSGLAEIIDEGVDPTIPTGQENWTASIAPANGAEIFKIVAGENDTPEGFSFDAITFSEQIRALDATKGGSFTSTGTVSVGDTYYVQANSKNYLFIIREVNAVANSNTDNYKLDIKVAE